MRTKPSSSMSILQSNSSSRPRIVSPPLPMMRPIWSESIFTVTTCGAYGESSVRGSEMAFAMLSRIDSRASRACASACRSRSAETPVILMSICRAVMPSFVPATLKSMSPR